MKNFLVASAAAAFGFVGVASAADMPTKAPVLAAPAVLSWTGFYLGVQGGADWSKITINEQASFGSNSATASTSTKKSSGEVGIYGGYRRQFGQGLVLGGEVDFNWTNLSGVTPPLELTAGGVPCGSGGASTLICVGPATSKIHWYSTVRGTVGHTAGPLLLYATGGLAFGEVASSVAGTLRVTTVNLPPFSVDQSAVRYGWTAGLGAAAKVSDRISLQLQWTYVDLGRHTIFATSGSVLPGGAPPAVPFSVSVKADRISFNTIRAGLAFQFP